LVLDERQRDWALAVVALRSATDLGEGAGVFAPVLAGWGEDARVRLARRLGELYPDPAGVELWQAPVPDRLTDTHLLDLARQAATQQQWCTELATVCATSDKQAAQRAAVVLHRCLSAPGRHAAGQARVAAGLTALVRGCPGAYVPVLTLLDPVGFGAELNAVIGDPAPLMAITDVRSLDEVLRELGFATTRTAVAVAVSQRLVADSRPAPDCTLDGLNAYAGQLNDLSVRSAELGQREEGLAAIEEAVAIRRRLVEANPAAYLPDLAMSLNNLSNRLGELGRREESLTPIEEAVTIRRRLAEANPAAYLPNLAGSLNNLSIRLGELGRREEGLTAIEEAVTVYRRLVEANPAAYLPDLATSLNNLSIRLGELGRREEGLTVIEEAVTIRRRLAEANPAAYLPNLATTLNNLSVDLGELGRREEGLTAIEEAVTIRRRLAEANPAAYLPKLAMSLNNLSNLLDELGKKEQAEAAKTEATQIRVQLTGSPGHLQRSPEPSWRPEAQPPEA
jgi:tetratricopeptide (TPR) repeat protein